MTSLLLAMLALLTTNGPTTLHLTCPVAWDVTTDNDGQIFIGCRDNLITVSFLPEVYDTGAVTGSRAKKNVSRLGWIKQTPPRPPRLPVDTTE